MNNELVYFFIALIGIPSMLALGIILGERDMKQRAKDYEKIRKWIKDRVLKNETKHS